MRFRWLRGAGDAAEHRSQWRRRVARIAGATAVLCLVLTTVVGFYPDDPDRVVVLGGMVVRPVEVGGVLLVAALLLSFARAMANPEASTEGSGADENHAGSATLRPRLLWPRRLTVAALVLAAIAGLARAALVDISSEYFVLDPPSAHGCRVIIDERLFLRTAGGSVHVLPAGQVATWRVGDYYADDGYRPVTFGTYELDWHGEQGHLALTTPPDSPGAWVEPQSFRLPC